jgi:serine/threonine-protein kinase
MSDTPLKSLGRYRIVSELGRGAMGVVYEAEDPELARTVAIKTIRIPPDAGEANEYVARFRQEARAVGALNHPAIITVFDAGREGDVAYMAMEVLEGAELRDLMAQAPLPLPLVLDLSAQIASALAFAHDRGVVHRDVKPGNIMVLPGNRVKLMDFGIARMRISEIKTQTGMLLGSPKYMSPEQVGGQRVDARSDIFSLGVVVHEMLTGKPAFAGADLNQLMFQVVNGAPTPPSHLNARVPGVLDSIVARALEKDPDKRYQSAAEMARDLEGAKDSLPDDSLLVPEDAAATLVVSDASASTGAAPPAAADSRDSSRFVRALRRDATLRQVVALLGAAAVVAGMMLFL